MAVGSVDSNYVVLNQCTLFQTMNMRDHNRITIIMMFLHYNGCKATKRRPKVLNNHNTEQNANVQVNVEGRITSIGRRTRQPQQDIFTYRGATSSICCHPPLPFSPLQPFYRQRRDPTNSRRPTTKLLDRAHGPHKHRSPSAGSPFHDASKDITFSSPAALLHRAENAARPCGC